MEIDATKLRGLAERARRLAGGVSDVTTRDRLLAAAAEYEQRAREVEMDNPSGQSDAFILKNSALIYPAAGFDAEEDHFGVMLGDREVGVIYRIGDEWLWSISLGMMGMASGRSASRREARQAFRASWDEKAARLGVQHVVRALAIARGKP